MNKLQWYDKITNLILDNVEKFYEDFYPKSMIQRVGKSYRLQPCPVCGHNDCSTVGEAVNCFSCGWKGTHINALIEYFMEVKGEPRWNAINALEDYFHLKYPRGSTKEEYEAAIHKERLGMIKIIAANFYHRKLMTDQTTYSYKTDTVTKEFTPLQYQLSIRGHSIDSLKAFRVGFVNNYLDLWNMLIKEGYSKEEIKEAKIWFPEGVYVYSYFHPITKEVQRMNIKNPFNITMKDKTGEDIVVPGMSSGDKVIGFAPGFSFNKPAMILEGENDAITVYEQGFTNVAWIGGNFNSEMLSIMERQNKPIYLCYDNDDVGLKYTERTDEELPHKDLRVIEFDTNYNDIDEYYRKSESPKPIDKLVSSAKKLTTDAFKIYQDREKWVIANRHKRLEFRITGRDNKGNIVGQTDFYVDGFLKDREEDKPLGKCRANKRPFNFYLSDAMEKYFNTDLEDRDFDELLDIYKYCSHKSQIIKLLAKHAYDSKDYEETIRTVRMTLGSDVCDAVLKEVNDLQNSYALKEYSSIPKIRISHYFNITNNDAYFYFTYIKHDGDAVRRLPYLLRNDRQMIRLDLLKRKDSQCLLLIDNKYELPDEVTDALFDYKECSLWSEWAIKYCEGKIAEEELNPHDILKLIETYVKKFYYFKDETIYKVLALWIYGTYYYELFGQYPYLLLNGEKGSGKSLLDTVLYMFCFNAKLAVDISEASLFRMIAVEGGTIIMDEVENLTSRKATQNSTMASLLKGGYAKQGKVYRVNMENSTNEGFEAFAPKVISNIFGVEDVIEDRCIRIPTYRLTPTKGIKMEDPKYYIDERMSEVREVTSKCCLSALEHFQTINAIYRNISFITKTARLTQILNPLYAIALYVDAIYENGNNPNLDVSKLDLDNIRGEYVGAFLTFYENVIAKTKEDIEIGTPEGIIKHVVEQIALEITDRIPSNQKEYTITHHHKYKEPIEFNLEEGWFDINVIHFKCFIEEHMPGETAYTRTVHKWVKSSFNIDSNNIKRRTANIEESEELTKEFKGNKKPKVNYYRFFINDFIKDSTNNFLSNAEKISPVKRSNRAFQEDMF